MRKIKTFENFEENTAYSVDEKTIDEIYDILYTDKNWGDLLPDDLNIAVKKINSNLLNYIKNNNLSTQILNYIQDKWEERFLYFLNINKKYIIYNQVISTINDFEDELSKY